MREPLRFLTVLAVLMGGLLGLKTLSIANGAAEWWDAQGSAMAAQASQEAEDGDADSDAPIMPAEHSEPVQLEAEPSALEVSAAFAERIASGVRTAEEERVIYRLRERSSELDARERQLETREALMLAMEQRVDTKIVELDALRTQIESLSGELSEREDADMAVIVSWYSAMEPGDASDRIATPGHGNPVADCLAHVAADIRRDPGGNGYRLRCGVDRAHGQPLQPAGNGGRAGGADCRRRLDILAD